MAGQFIVVSLSADLPRHTDCRIYDEDAIYPQIYTRVFDPAPRDECERWVEGNCGPETEDKG